MPTVRQVYLYEDKNLPKCGWFQGCVVCSTITSKVQEYKFKSTINNLQHYEFYSYLCPPCQRLIKSDKNELAKYKQIANEMIFFQLGLY